MNPTYTEYVIEPWFSHICEGKKTIEGRKNNGRFKTMKEGETILFKNQDSTKSILTEVVGKRIYPSFKSYLETETLNKCLPGIKDIIEGQNIYYNFYSIEDELKYGVVAIEIKSI